MVNSLTTFRSLNKIMDSNSIDLNNSCESPILIPLAIPV